MTVEDQHILNETAQSPSDFNGTIDEIPTEINSEQQFNDDNYEEQSQEIIPERIFVGNLPYEVTEDDVKGLTPDFEIVSVEIPRKHFYNRALNQTFLQSKGYGFITYKNAEDAKKAIESIVDKSISGREIYAKYALPQNKNKFLNPNNNQMYNNYRNKNIYYNSTNGSFAPSFSIRNGQYNSYYPNQPNGYYPAPPQGNFYRPGPAFYPSAPSSASASSPQNGQQLPLQLQQSIKPFYPSNQYIPQSSQHRPYTPQPAKTKEEKLKKLQEGTPSTTTIFVGNLDRNVTVDDLRDLLKDLNPQWIRVPRKTLPKDVYRMLKASGVPIQNKGIAFIRFDSEESQKLAIEEFNGKMWKGKNLNVTVAINANDEVELGTDSDFTEQTTNDKGTQKENDDDGEITDAGTEAETDVEVVIGDIDTQPEENEES